jgi:hypothetical protein
MKLLRLFAAALPLMLTICVPPALNAQDDDLFAFIPDGGRTLLAGLLASGSVAPDEILGASRDSADWLAFLKDRAGDRLDDWQAATLAAYLAATMPAAERGGMTIETDGRALPRDGRDMVLEYCQSCHIITVVVTQDRSREAWLGTMNKPSHVEIDTTQAEREAIADYLVINAGISIEDIPPELRAGGATY